MALISFLCPGVCRREFVAQRYLLSTTTCLITQSTFLASVPFGNGVGPSPAVQSEWNLRLCQFSSLWSRPHSAYLILRCITSTIRFCSVWKTALFFCRACEIMQTPNLQSSSRSVALRACRVQIAHTSTVLPVGSLGGSEQKKGPCLINIPKAQSLLLSGFSPSSPFFFWFLLQPWAVSDSPLFSFLLQLLSVTKHPASHPLTLFPSKLGESECEAGGGGRGGQTRLLLLVTQSWLWANTSTMFVLPHSLPPTEWLTLPLALPPSLSPSKSVLRLHSFSQSYYFGSKGGGLAWWGSVFFLIQLCVAQWGGGWWELWSGFKSGIEERGGGRGSSAGVAHRLLWPSELRGQ